MVVVISEGLVDLRQRQVRMLEMHLLGTPPVGDLGAFDPRPTALVEHDVRDGDSCRCHRRRIILSWRTAGPAARDRTTLPSIVYPLPSILFHAPHLPVKSPPCPTPARPAPSSSSPSPRSSSPAAPPS